MNPFISHPCDEQMMFIQTEMEITFIQCGLGCKSGVVSQVDTISKFCKTYIKI